MLALLKPGDVMGFRKFYNFVVKCETFSKSRYWDSLETPETLYILVSNLAGGLRDRWYRMVPGLRMIYDRELYLSDFSK